ncbi:MAG: hypothetical protein OXU69_01495 [Gemmatimonadota bacterium]|nr:hypothetical protein [Gemmatimonadota bacterium]MDE2983351.1 hypothetical protein [Gemmatimonadota bacterium]
MTSAADGAAGRAVTAAAIGDLPGADLVARGIQALRRGETTIEALLVSVGAPRLRAAGLDIPPAPPLPHAPEISLYLAIGADHPRDAHSRYNALIRRLVSFERALERRVRAEASGR